MALAHDAMRVMSVARNPWPRCTLPLENAVATKPIAAAPRKDERHGLFLERHQDNGRPVRARAARHLLRRKADRAGAARDDRQSKRSAAQARLSNPPGRDQATRDALGTSLQVARQRAQDGGLP